MNQNEPHYRKLHLELLNHFEPIVLWWSDGQIRDWDNKKVEFILKPNTVRIKSTPYSFIEFDWSNFISLILIDENEKYTDQLSFEETQFFKYLILNHLPVPTCTFNEEFDFPISLIAYRNGSDHNFFDLSNYITLNYLIERGIGFKDYIEDINDWSKKDFEPDNLTFIEYSKMKI